MTIEHNKLPLRKSSKPRARCDGRTLPRERRDAKSARKAASWKSAQIGVGSPERKIFLSSLDHPPLKAYVATVISR